MAFVEPAALTRWLPLSGTLQPVDQTTVKSKVSGEIRQVTVREGQAVKAGQVIVRFDTADLEAKLTDLEAQPAPFDPTRFGGQWNYTLIDPVPSVTLTSPTNNGGR